MVEIRGLRRSIKVHIDVKNIVLILLSVAVFAVFIDRSLALYLGPLMALAMAYLFFNGYMEMITALIIVANDALGTILLGSISFHYLLLIMVALNIVLERRFSKTNLMYFIISAAFALQLYFVGFLDMRAVIYTLTFVLALINIPREPQNMTSFFRGVILAVVLIAAHACVTGGVEFYELNEYSQEVLRRGILGIGVGDSNYSCFLLCIGLVCVWYEKKLNVLLKLLITGMILYSTMITLSVSGFLAIVIVFMVGVVLSKKKWKALLIALVVVLLAVMLFSEYTQLPEELRNEVLDGYILRVTEKYEAFIQGNYSTVTTNRSDLFNSYAKYIFEEQSVWKMLFGGNTIEVFANKIPHNTYLDVILQFGCIGAIAFFAWVLRKMWEMFSNKSSMWGVERFFVLKILCLFVATNLSLYEGSLWSLWFYFLIAF